MSTTEKTGGNAAAWFALVQNAASCLEDAAACLQDADAKRAAEGAAKHYRDASQLLYAAEKHVQEPKGKK